MTAAPGLPLRLTHFQTQRKLCVNFNIDGKAGVKSVAL